MTESEMFEVSAEHRGDAVTSVRTRPGDEPRLEITSGWPSQQKLSMSYDQARALADRIFTLVHADVDPIRATISKSSTPAFNDKKEPQKEPDAERVVYVGRPVSPTPVKPTGLEMAFHTDFGERVTFQGLPLLGLNDASGKPIDEIYETPEGNFVLVVPTTTAGSRRIIPLMQEDIAPDVVLLNGVPEPWCDLLYSECTPTVAKMMIKALDEADIRPKSIRID